MEPLGLVLILLALVIGLFPLSAVGFRFGWRSAAREDQIPDPVAQAQAAADAGEETGCHQQRLQAAAAAPRLQDRTGHQAHRRTPALEEFAPRRDDGIAALEVGTAAGFDQQRVAGERHRVVVEHVSHATAGVARGRARFERAAAELDAFAVDQQPYVQGFLGVTTLYLKSINGNDVGGGQPINSGPAFVTKDGKPFLSFGVMGGATQPQGHAQIVMNVVDFGMNVQEAGDAPRQPLPSSSAWAITCTASLSFATRSPLAPRLALPFL